MFSSLFSRVCSRSTPLTPALPIHAENDDASIKAPVSTTRALSRPSESAVRTRWPMKIWDVDYNVHKGEQYRQKGLETLETLLEEASGRSDPMPPRIKTLQDQLVQCAA